MKEYFYTIQYWWVRDGDTEYSSGFENVVIEAENDDDAETALVDYRTRMYPAFHVELSVTKPPTRITAKGA